MKNLLFLYLLLKFITLFGYESLDQRWHSYRSRKILQILQTPGRLRETLERLSLNCFAKILGL